MAARPDASGRRAFFRGLAAAARDAARGNEAARGDDAVRGDEAAPRDPTAAVRHATPVVAAELQALERYSRQLVLPEWSDEAQQALAEASVLVVGAGALGSPVAAYLAGAGVGRLGIVDDGAVELSNLHRQHLHFTPDIGVAKAQSAAAKLGFLNPDIAVEPYQARFSPAMLPGQDLVVDCTDRYAARYEINAACCHARTPLVEAGVLGLTGLVMAIRPGETACYRCAFPDAPAHAPSCAEAGTLGPAAGVIGSLQALEAIKLLAGLPEPLTNAFLHVDLADHSFVRVRTTRRDDCPDCRTL